MHICLMRDGWQPCHLHSSCTHLCLCHFKLPQKLEWTSAVEKKVLHKVCRDLIVGLRYCAR